LIVLIKFRGSVEDVRAAVEAGKTVAESISGVISSYIIASPDPQTEPMFKLKAFDKN
jgi:microcompartment protein CcmL/EutN